MNLSLSFFIGYRYWRARKANAFASFITIFSVSGILLGVAALIVVSSVMNGLEGQLKHRILGAVPQLTVQTETALDNWQQDVVNLSAINGVQGVTPNVSTQAMLQSASNIGAAQLYGVYPEREKSLLNIQRNIYSGQLDELKPGKYQIILGTELARTLDLSVGDKVRVLSGDGVVYSPFGPIPSQRKFTVIGVFEVGSQVDATVGFIHHDDAQRLMRQQPGDVKQLRIYLDDPFTAPAITPNVVNYFSQPVTTTDWRDSYGHLFGAVKMEKNMMSLMLSLIIAVAAFNIVSALVMMVVDKTTDVAVLKTQGLTTTNVMAIFMIQGSLNAIIGLITGVAAGVLLTINLNEITNALGISILGAGQHLPVQLELSQLSTIVIGTLVMTLLATIYPALRAANVQPATALRYE
ncbi:lipoprotein-releasing ABC transporter permease subunit [Shewanella youngdeokensis]|uniref:Lipoprotein-releasing ABC transporter permease subunit n=1 Tax=Shewanella youngdeokensis TaxID=2999068 RepID=A0ABZ0K3P6_9GAMM|nr:lipoprotein-releasing ABC transporter permease subunit [Shewanella sp. DAU334]